MSLRHFILYAMLCFSLAGCLLDQKEPKPDAITLAPYAGVVSVEDIDAGERQQANVRAFFMTAQEEKKPMSRAAAMAATLRADDTEAMKCTTKLGAVTEETKDDKVRNVTVGRIFFGPALQKNLQVLYQDGTSNYRLPLEAKLAAGAYQVVAEGSKEAQGFSEILSLPEALEGVQVNGHDVREPGMSLKRSEDVEIRWKSPSMLNDQNLILIDFISQNDSSRGSVHCVGREVALGQSGGLIEYTISRNTISQFPVDVTARVHVVRAHLRRAASRRSEVQFQGLRTNISLFDFLP